MHLVFNKNYTLITICLLCLEIAIALWCSSGFIRYTFGDVLAVILVYCFFKSFIKTKNAYLAAIALGISYSIEFAQAFKLLDLLKLSHINWLVVVFGSHFSILDLVAYTVGILIFLYIEITFF